MTRNPVGPKSGGVAGQAQETNQTGGDLTKSIGGVPSHRRRMPKKSRETGLEGKMGGVEGTGTLRTWRGRHQKKELGGEGNNYSNEGASNDRVRMEWKGG